MRWFKAWVLWSFATDYVARIRLVLKGKKKGEDITDFVMASICVGLSHRETEDEVLAFVGRPFLGVPIMIGAYALLWFYVLETLFYLAYFFTERFFPPVVGMDGAMIGEGFALLSFVGITIAFLKARSIINERMKKILDLTRDSLFFTLNDLHSLVIADDFASELARVNEEHNPPLFKKK